MEHDDQVLRDRLAAELAGRVERFVAVGAVLTLIRLPIEQRASDLVSSDSFANRKPMALLRASVQTEEPWAWQQADSSRS